MKEHQHAAEVEILKETTQETAQETQLLREGSLLSQVKSEVKLQVKSTGCWVIEMTVPDKPKSQLQKYRLTAKGTAIQTSLQRGIPK